MGDPLWQSIEYIWSSPNHHFSGATFVLGSAESMWELSILFDLEGFGKDGLYSMMFWDKTVMLEYKTDQRLVCLFLLLASVIWFSSLLLLDNYDSTLGEDQGLPTSLSQKAMVMSHFRGCNVCQGFFPFHICTISKSRDFLGCRNDWIHDYMIHPLED